MAATVSGRLRVVAAGGTITAYRVNMKVTFLLK